jgi:hypothetical protein
MSQITSYGNGLSIPITVPQGGTGQVTLTDHGVLLGQGVNPVIGQVLTDGQLLVGSTGLDPVATGLTAGTGITVTPGAGSITVATAGSVASSFPTDVGTATPALGVLTVSGSTNILTTGAGSTVTIDFDDIVTDIASITFQNNGFLQTGTTAGNTLFLGAYNNTTASYDTFATLTANLVPTFDLATGTTIGTSYIYRAGGTDIPVADGGTGVSTLTSHGILLGNGSSAIQATAEPSDGQLLIGSTGNAPVLASLTAGANITITPGAGAITIASTASGGIGTIDGDTGSVTGATVSIKGNGSAGAGKTVLFSGAAAAMSLGVTDAGNNTAIGLGSGNALNQAGGAASNTLIGSSAGAAITTAIVNTCVGANCGVSITGSANTLVGQNALSSVTTGQYNTAIGYSVGGNYATSDSNNITIGVNVLGSAGESNALRIGASTGSSTGQLSKAYICGIDGVNVGSVAKVVTMASDQLGTATITAGANITITPSANAITIASTGGGTSFTWTETTSDASLVAANGYIANKAGLLTMTLPASGAIGDIIEITNMNTAVGWRIAQNANQYIRLGSSLTTTGVGGYLEATALGDSVKLVCMVAGASTGWICTSVLGNITIA